MDSEEKEKKKLINFNSVNYLQNGKVQTFKSLNTIVDSAGSEISRSQLIFFKQFYSFRCIDRKRKNDTLC